MSLDRPSSSKPQPVENEHPCRLCPATFHKAWLLDKHLHAKQVPRWPKGDACLCPVPECPEYFSNGLLLNWHLEEAHDQQQLGSREDKAVVECAVTLHNLCTLVEARCPQEARGHPPAPPREQGGPPCRLRSNGVATPCVGVSSALYPIFGCTRCRGTFHVRCGQLEYVEEDEGKVVCGSCRKRAAGRKDGQVKG